MLDITTQNKIERLLELYKIYQHLGNVDDKSLRQCLGSIMRFDTPLVWLGYKTKAYCGTTHAINTIADLRVHCSDPDDICAKRFNFIRDIINVSDDENIISVLWNDPLNFSRLSSQDLVSDWIAHEFYEVDGRICKWENYRCKLAPL